MEEESYRHVRKSWIGGNGTMYFGIPPKIIKKLNLGQSQYLLVDVIGDIIVIKKMNQQFSKSEIKKIQTTPLQLTKKMIQSNQLKMLAKNQQRQTMEITIIR